MKNQLFYNCVIGQTLAVDGFQPAGKLSLEAAFAVYQRGYIARLTETLGDIFESVWKVLGDEIFFDVSRKFIAANPSQVYNLSDYSVKFIDFLISQSVSVEFPFLPDLAHLGWLHKEIFHRPMTTSLSDAELMALLEDDNGIAALVETVELLASGFRIFDIWKALKDETRPPEFWKGPQYLVLYKFEQQVYVKQVSEGQYRAFENIRIGMPLITALEHLEELELTDLFHLLSKHSLLRGKR
jgi:hypothetical protein